MKTLTVLTPCYNEEDGIRECRDTVSQIFSEHLAGYRLEHIFCDNASTDQTVEILKEMAKESTSVKVIINSRNF